MIPEVIQIGPLSLRMYGVFIAIGIYTGLYFITSKLNDWDFPVEITVEEVWNGFAWILVPTVLGARLYHVIDEWSFYSQNPELILQIWNGGLGIFGAILFGALAIAGYGYWKTKSQNPSNLKQAFKDRALSYLDLVALSMPLGQSIGRWGNWVNQELYGLPSDLPWAIFISPEKRLAGYESFSHFHPLFLYESLWNLASWLFIWLYFVRYKKQKFGTGRLFLWYLALYGTSRIVLENLRLEFWDISSLPLSTAQTIGVVTIISLIVYEFQSRKV